MNEAGTNETPDRHERLLGLLNQIMTNKGKGALTTIDAGMKLRQDLGFDSFDLAELTVRLEEAFGVDVFAEGLVNTVGEVLARLSGADGARD